MLRSSRFFWLGQPSTFFPYPALEYHIIAYAIFREYFFLVIKIVFMLTSSLVILANLIGNRKDYSLLGE
ncbi:MAG: hypothetical protein WCC82_09225 [Nitrososphaeraceae archaeon]